MSFGFIVVNSKKTGITTLYNLKWLHTESSTKEAIKLLPLQSTWDLKKKLTFKYALSVKTCKLKQEKWNQDTFYILKMLYTGCSTNEAIRFVDTNSKKINWNQNTVHFRNATYKALHEKSNQTAFFVEHLKFWKILILTNTLSVKSGKLK